MDIIVPGIFPYPISSLLPFPLKYQSAQAPKVFLLAVLLLCSCGEERRPLRSPHAPDVEPAKATSQCMPVAVGLYVGWLLLQEKGGLVWFLGYPQPESGTWQPEGNRLVCCIFLFHFLWFHFSCYLRMGHLTKSVIMVIILLLTWFNTYFSLFTVYLKIAYILLKVGEK